jgi:drug/metabolite transporter (DMT)-like permease
VQDSSVKTAMGTREWAMLVALSMLWGGSFLFVGVAVEELPPLVLVTVRIGLAALALLIALRILGISLPRAPRVWGAFVIMGVVNNLIPFTLIAWAQSHIAGGLASILNATTPLFGVVVAHYATEDEGLTAQKLVGVALGFGGVMILMGDEALRSFGAEVLAQIAVLVASLSYAVSGVFARRFNRMGVAPLATAAGMLTVSTAMLLPITLIFDRPWILAAPSPAAIASMTALALISTAFAYLLYFRILAAAGATNILLVTFLIPVSAIMLGAAVLGERLEPKHFYGMALIGLGLAAIDGRPFRAARRLVSGLRALR